jgi:hypothetical protein
LHNGKADAIVDKAKVLDFVIRAGLLAAKLVAGKAENGKVLGVLVLDGFVDLLEAVVLRGEPALGGSVDNENDLALVVSQRDLLAALYEATISTWQAVVIWRGRVDKLSSGLKS